MSKSTLKQGTDYKAGFESQKALPKKDVMRLPAGTWIVLKWTDSPNSVALLLEKPVNLSGDVSLKCYLTGTDRKRWVISSRPVHTQVVAVLGDLAPPAVRA